MAKYKDTWNDEVFDITKLDEATVHDIRRLTNGECNSHADVYKKLYIEKRKDVWKIIDHIPGAYVPVQPKKPGPREIDRIRERLKEYPNLDIYVVANNLGKHYWDTINTYISYKKEPVFVTKEFSYLGCDYDNAYVLLCQNWYESPIVEKESFRHFLREAKFKIPLGETPLIRTDEVSRKLSKRAYKNHKRIASPIPISESPLKVDPRILPAEEANNRTRYQGAHTTPEEGPELILPDSMYFYIGDKIREEKAQELQKKLNAVIDGALDYYNEGIKEGNTISKKRYDTLVRIKQKIGQSADDFLGIDLDELNEIVEVKYKDMVEFISDIMSLSSYHIKKEK